MIDLKRENEKEIDYLKHKIMKLVFEVFERQRKDLARERTEEIRTLKCTEACDTQITRSSSSQCPSLSPSVLQKYDFCTVGCVWLKHTSPIRVIDTNLIITDIVHFEHNLSYFDFVFDFSKRSRINEDVFSYLQTHHQFLN